MQFGGGNGREVLIRTVFQDAINKCESSQLASLLEKIRAVLDDVSASQDDKNDKRKIEKDRGTTTTETPVREVSSRIGGIKSQGSRMQDSNNPNESTNEPGKQKDGQQNINNLKTSMFRRIQNSGANWRTREKR